MLPAPEVWIAVHVFMAVVFAVAAIGKMREWSAFQGVIANYRLLPAFAVRPVAYLLPPAELAVAFALLGGAAVWPEIAAAALLLLFALAMTVNLLRGRRHIDCGCYSSAQKQSLRWALVCRNVFMALLLCATLALRGGAASVPLLIEAMMAGGAMFIVYQSLNSLLAVPAWRASRARS
jgi:Methylamine utilisation protein MauE